MPQVLKVLGQLYPSSGTLTALYTVPSATQTVVSSLIVTNQSSGSTTFSISIAVAGAADSPLQYIYSAVPILGNDSFVATVGLTLGAGDVIRVLSGNGLVSISAYGQENS